jgi:ADP-ribose pyrophosphatase YjhB (NUDIX family)
MFVKIYFNDKPLFLCDAISSDLEPYVHHDDAVFVDELSSPAVNTIIHEMQSDKVHAGVFLHPDMETLKKAFWKKFELVQAAGGLVSNREKKMLFMFRRGKWDLPKGKLDPGESLEECAVREVREETGLKDLELNRFLLTTYHTYQENGRHILKESYWYTMEATGSQDLVPQTEEDIQEVKWVSEEDLHELLENTYPSVYDVLLENNKLASGI